MLNGIKEMINKKTDFLEAATIIFEDTDNLDDSIVLGEENEIPEEPDFDNEELDGNDDENLNTDNKEDVDKGEENEQNHEPIIDNNNSGDIMDEPIDNLSGDGLPNLVGRQTGEPANTPDDILDVEIDLQSNTLKDILPVPPSNAIETLTDDDDIMNQRIDSGFEGEENEPVATENEPLTEAISLNGDGTNTDDTQSSENNSSTGDDNTENIDLGSDGGDSNEEENDVTSAVRDKVAELDTPTDTETGGTVSGNDIMKKLSNMTKNLEDVKKAVMDNIQTI